MTQIPSGTPDFLERQDGEQLAYVKTEAASGKEKPTVVFLGGFMSDMEGSKATFLEQLARDEGFGYVRFDYLGHGQSSGRFVDGTISRWTEDALTIVDELTEGPLILIGSSMGGWIMLNIALQRADRIHSLIGIAAAPDFTQELMWEKFDQDAKDALLNEGVYHQPSDYGDPYPITLKLIEDGRQHLLLNRKLPIDCPVHLLQGMQDKPVPWDYAPRIVEALRSTDVQVTLIKDGDHSLSREEDLERLKSLLTGMLHQ
ncbi:alpha/beta fold hydrolase [Kiloniella sp. b19]|uniref:alpha/beta fold hydrolase n=1 Tax=Kiloniella sp. GXU_MW_B19 TaxID=3141326 RepID=UPI0031D83D84